VAAVSLLLAIHVCLSFLGVLNRSVTSDETGHLTAGYAYWKFNDYRLQPENGNLPQRWAALPLLIAQPTLDPKINPQDWSASRVWNIAQGFLFERGNNTDYLLLSARSIMLLWSVAAGLLVFFWSRSIWGDAPGVGTLALFTFSPTTLAHGPLVTSDMCAAFCLLAAVAAWWRMCLSPGFIRILIAGAATGLAFVAKYSAVLLLPTFIVLTVLVAVGSFFQPENPSRWLSRACRLSCASLIVAMITLGIVWAFFGFRYSAANSSIIAFDHFYLPWERVFPDGGLLATLVQLAKTGRILPEAFLYGFSFVVYFSAGRGAFLAGNFSSTGWWWFFPFAFLVKSTVGELLVTASLVCKGFVAVRASRCFNLRRIAISPLTPLAVFALIFGAVTLSSHLNIGQRHILPLYLILFIAAGTLFSVRNPRWLRVLGTAAVLLSGIESVANHPNHLAFFNRLAGGPANGWRLLVDSSLDWGQDVTALGTWVRKNRQGNEPVFVSWFGTADPKYEGIYGEDLSPYYSLGKPRRWIDLSPGLFCISATMLQDVYGIRPGPWTVALEKDFQTLKAAARYNIENKLWDTSIPENGFHPEHPLWLLDRLRFARLCQYLKVKEPLAVINHTQFVFRLSAEELEIFSDKPYSALAKLMESGGRESRVPKP
jgi:4-amino-4-deoxy-L-arabinose transferase-like glycosyltransferase